MHMKYDLVKRHWAQFGGISAALVTVSIYAFHSAEFIWSLYTL